MRHLRGGLSQQGPALAHLRIAQQVGVSNKRSDAQAVSSDVQTSEAFDPIDIDDDGRFEDAKVEHGHEALAPGQDATVLAGTAQEMKRFIQFAGRVIIEPCGFHACHNLIGRK